MLRHLLQGKRARVGDDAAFVDFDARQPRDIGAGGDEDALFRSQGPGAAFDELDGEPVRRLEIRAALHPFDLVRSEEHTSELQSLMRISYAVFCLKKKKKTTEQIELYMSERLAQTHKAT